jgi:hypothetical protein
VSWKRKAEFSEMPRDRKMGFKKGRSGNPTGRPRGAKNKLPRNLVDRILEISAKLEEQGMGLQECAEESPRWFFENFMKSMIPKNIALDKSEQIVIRVEEIPRKKPIS